MKTKIMRTAGKAAAVAVLAAALSSACVSHLRSAKTFYVRAGEEEARFRTVEAVALYKRARLEASREIGRRPSAQAYLVKGLAEVDLGLWKDAEASFAAAVALGHDQARSWASDAALLGLAASFEELGLSDQAGRVYAAMVKSSKFRPAVMTAASRRTEAVLRASIGLPAAERGKVLAGLLKEIDALLTDDYACGLYHYLASQVCGHAGDPVRSYEEAVAARELGLPSEKILRDNDNQLVFCYKLQLGGPPSRERDVFEARHRSWAARWGWPSPDKPAWKKD